MVESKLACSIKTHTFSVFPPLWTSTAKPKEAAAPYWKADVEGCFPTWDQGNRPLSCTWLVESALITLLGGQETISLPASSP